MTTPVLLVPHGEAVYAVPVEEAKKYALDGESLANAVAILNEESDVTGQRFEIDSRNAYKWNSRGEAYIKPLGGKESEWVRAPQND